MMIKLIIILAFVIWGMLAKPKKHMQCYDLIFLAFIAILMYFSEERPDFSNYEQVYNKIGEGLRYKDTGYGWLVLCMIGCRLKLSYRAFSSLLFFFFGLLMSNTIRSLVKKAKNQKKVWALFLIFPSLLEATQIRFFVAECIVLFAFKLFFRKDVLGYSMYGMLCIIASFVHTSALFYLFFLLSPIFHRIKKILPWIVSITSVFMLFGSQIIIKLASIFVNASRIQRYFSYMDSIGIFGVIAYTFTLTVFWIFAKRMYRSRIYKTIGKYQQFVVESFYHFSVIIWLLLPMTLLDTNFFRIQRILWILLYSVVYMMKENGLQKIRIFRNTISTRHLSAAISTFGFVFYIFMFNQDVIFAFFS